MQMIRLSEIIIPKARQRQDFDPEALMELTNSIERLGLMQAPVVRKTSAGITLVSGERRIRAIEDLWATGGDLHYAGHHCAEGEIPVVSMGELSELDAWEAELDENLKRRDLTWQEHAEAVKKLMLLRQSQVSGLRVETTPYTHNDLALEVTGTRSGGPANEIRKELIVADHLDNPAVAKAKNVDEAFKILKRQEERQENIRRAETMDEQADKSDQFVLLQGNCLLLMPNLEDRFDVILTDPPYGMGADSFGDGGGKLAGIEHHYDDSLEAWTGLMSVWAELAFAIAKPQAHAYVFCDIDNFKLLREFMQRAGWQVFRTPLIVHKINSGRVPWPTTGPRRSWEAILYAVKGNKPVTNIYPDVIPCKGDDNLGHGAQKPVELYADLLRRSCRPGDRVLDTFAGTGTIFAAARDAKLFATGIEQDAGNIGICLKRLAELARDDEPELDLGELTK